MAARLGIKTKNVISKEIIFRRHEQAFLRFANPQFADAILHRNFRLRILRPSFGSFIFRFTLLSYDLWVMRSSPNIGTLNMKKALFHSEKKGLFYPVALLEQEILDRTQANSHYIIESRLWHVF